MILLVVMRFVIFALILFAVIITINSIFEKRKQKKVWNNGRCPICNGKWIIKHNYSKDFIYKRVYTCENNPEHKCVITYESIDLNNKED